MLKDYKEKWEKPTTPNLTSPFAFMFEFYMIYSNIFVLFKNVKHGEMFSCVGNNFVVEWIFQFESLGLMIVWKTLQDITKCKREFSFMTYSYKNPYCELNFSM